MENSEYERPNTVSGLNAKRKELTKQSVYKSWGTSEVNYTPDTLPPLTDVQRAHLEKLADTPDGQINYDDIPRLTDAQLAEFKRPEHYSPMPKSPF